MSLAKSFICVLFAISALALVPASAEDAPPAPDGGAKQGGGQGGGGQGGRGNFDPEQFKQRMLDRMKESLGLSDDEMKALQPKIEAVQKLQAQVRGGARGFGGFGGGGGMQRRRGGNGGGGDATPAAPTTPPEPKSESEKKTQELQALVDNKENTDVKAIKAKLQEVREIREKARGDLKKAQDELRELLTPKQEAQLVLMGILE